MTEPSDFQPTDTIETKGSRFKLQEQEALNRDLYAIDQHLRSKGCSLRSVIEHVAKTAFGISVDLPR